jgi:hypothetical protein
MQALLSTLAFPFTWMASNAHARWHDPHALQASAFTSATKPDDVIIGTPCLTMDSIPPQQHLQQLQMA